MPRVQATGHRKSRLASILKRGGYEREVQIHHTVLFVWFNAGGPGLFHNVPTRVPRELPVDGHGFLIPPIRINPWSHVPACAQR